MQTTHFLLPEFEQNSAVDLINIYNKAIESIDVNLFNTKKIADEAKKCYYKYKTIYTIIN